MIYLTKVFHFHAAHLLKNHSGKCKYLHGHSYILEVTLRGEISNSSGMLYDFGDVKKIVKDNIIKIVDHKYLNNVNYGLLSLSYNSYIHILRKGRRKK